MTFLFAQFKKKHYLCPDLKKEIMSDTIATIILIILAILLYKIVIGYIAILAFFGLIGAAIGAIFGEGIWLTCAYVGVAIGLVIVAWRDFENVWRTALGLLLGGGIGWLIGLLFNGSMWDSVVCLAGAIIGACIISPDAYEMMTRQSKTSSYNSRGTYKDALYQEHNGTPSGQCRDCRYYNDDVCNYYNASVHRNDNACSMLYRR